MECLAPLACTGTAENLGKCSETQHGSACGSNEVEDRPARHYAQESKSSPENDKDKGNGLASCACNSFTCVEIQEDEDELGSLSVEISSSSSWSTVPSASPPLECQSQQPQSKEGTDQEKEHENDGESGPATPLDFDTVSQCGCTSSSSAATKPIVHDLPYPSCSTGMTLDRGSDHLPWDQDDDYDDSPLLLCGNYVDYDSEESVAKRDGILAEYSSNLNCNGGDQEKVPPLPLFFATRFRTMDAERWAKSNPKDSPTTSLQLAASPASPYGTDTSCATATTVDLYDMFNWLTAGSTSASPAFPAKSLTAATTMNRAANSLQAWNGHLSLGPEQPSDAWKARRIKRRRRKHGLLPPPPIFHTTTTYTSSAEAEEAEFMATCFHPIPFHTTATTSHTPQLQLSSAATNETIPLHLQHRQLARRNLIRPLPIVPVNRPGQEDWEMVFVSVCRFPSLCLHRFAVRHTIPTPTCYLQPCLSLIRCFLFGDSYQNRTTRPLLIQKEKRHTELLPLPNPSPFQLESVRPAAERRNTQPDTRQPREQPTPWI